jgi:hypothetical protein
MRCAFEIGSANATLRIAVSRPRSMRRARLSAALLRVGREPVRVALDDRDAREERRAECLDALFLDRKRARARRHNPPVADAGRSVNDGSTAVARTAAPIQAGTTSHRSRTRSHANAALMAALIPAASRFYAKSADERGDVPAVGLALVLVQRVRVELVLADLATVAEVERGEDRAPFVDLDAAARRRPRPRRGRSRAASRLRRATHRRTAKRRGRGSPSAPRGRARC